jgi:hypothetical protein
MERKHLGDLDENIRMVLKLILRKQGTKCWGRINLLRMKSEGGVL